MRVNIDTNSFMKYVMEELNMVPQNLENQKKPMLNKISKIIKKNVEESLPKSDKDINDTNHDGTPYTHMRNDVKASIKDDNMGNVFVLVRGGKATGYKWHMVDNGTSDTKALHFTDKAMKKSEEEINSVVDNVISRAVQYGK